MRTYKEITFLSVCFSPFLFEPLKRKLFQGFFRIQAVSKNFMKDTELRTTASGLLPILSFFSELVQNVGPRLNDRPFHGYERLVNF